MDALITSNKAAESIAAAFAAGMESIERGEAEELNTGEVEEGAEEVEESSEEFVDAAETSEHSISEEEPTPPVQDELSKALDLARAEATQQRTRSEQLEAQFAQDAALAKLPEVPTLRPFDKLSENDQNYVRTFALEYGMGLGEAAVHLQKQVIEKAENQRNAQHRQLLGDREAVVAKVCADLSALSDEAKQSLTDSGFPDAFEEMRSGGAFGPTLERFAMAAIAHAEKSTASVKKKAEQVKTATKDSREALKRSTKLEATKGGSGLAPVSPTKSSAQEGAALKQSIMNAGNGGDLFKKLFFK